MLSDQQILEQVAQEKEKQRELQTLQNMSKEEAQALLKSLFLEVGVVSTWKWDDALRNIKSDSRYIYLKMPIHEQKSVFAEFMVEQRQRERDQ